MYSYPDHWAFKKFAQPRDLFRKSLNRPYDARVDAVAIKRTYATHRLNVPGWLREMTA